MINKKGILSARFTTVNVAIVLLVCSMLVFTFYFRMNISSMLAYINALFYLSIVVLAIKCRASFNGPFTILWLFCALIFTITDYCAGVGPTDIVKFFFMSCAPLLFVQIDSWKSVDTAQAARVLVRAVNCCVFIVFAVLVIDLVTGSAAMRALTANFLPEMTDWVESGVFDRHASIWGHYLSTSSFCSQTLPTLNLLAITFSTFAFSTWLRLSVSLALEVERPWSYISSLLFG